MAFAMAPEPRSPSRPKVDLQDGLAVGRDFKMFDADLAGYILVTTRAAVQGDLRFIGDDKFPWLSGSPGFLTGLLGVSPGPITGELFIEKRGVTWRGKRCPGRGKEP